MKEKLYSLRTAAKEVGCPYATLHYWLFNNVIKMPELKVGCRYFYTPEEIEELKIFYKKRNEDKEKRK